MPSSVTDRVNRATRSCEARQVPAPEKAIHGEAGRTSTRTPKPVRQSVEAIPDQSGRVHRRPSLLRPARPPQRPLRTTYDGLDLYTWLDRRRTEHRTNRLSAEDKTRLDDMGMIWEPGRDRRQTKIEELRRYQLQHGPIDDPGLYQFMTRMRKAREAGQLNDERLALLEFPPLSWSFMNVVR